MPQELTTSTTGAPRSFAKAALEFGAFDIDPVVQAFVSFDQSDVGAQRVASERGQDLVARLGVEVEIVAGRPLARVSHIGSM